MKQLYEKLDLFYLGRDTASDALTLLKNSDLTTHAAIIGMTGSGKTGLGIALMEEAMLDNIPALIIDPKGDMGNLCLRSPRFEAADFVPWVGEEKAEATAALWKQGIESWHQDSERSERLSQSDVTIYTPGSSAGVSVNILSSLEAPSRAVREESELLGSTLQSTVASLLSLIGEDADAHSKSAAFLGTLIMTLWERDVPMSLETLIEGIITPPFEKVGVMELERFFSESERFKLANRFNSVIANPTFAQWLEGSSLDFDTLLYDKNAKARTAVFNIAHLSDRERMFFVTLLLNRFVGWMRRQSGATTLRTLLYMDEIYGYFPPSANPPSKTPMMLLLKQARAFGVGVVLSTQNPVDLDYKGLSNIGTWFIGRLQTSQDIDRIIEGLSGKLGSDQDAASLRQALASLAKRTFLLKSVHRDAIEMFATRWVLSYLKGPLGREEIKQLMAAHQPQQMPQPAAAPRVTKIASAAPVSPLPHYFAPDAPLLYPHLIVEASIAYINPAKNLDVTRTLTLELPLDAAREPDPSKAVARHAPYRHLGAETTAACADLPPLLTHSDAKSVLQKSFTDFLYRNAPLERYRQRTLKLEAAPDETLQAFTIRVRHTIDTQRRDAVEALKQRYALKIERLESQRIRTMAKLEKEQMDVSAKTTDTIITAGLALLGSFFGRRSTSKIGSAVSKGARIAKERHDVTQVEAEIARLEDELEALHETLEREIDALDADYTLEAYPVETVAIAPKKRDIAITDVAIVWEAS